MAEVEAKVMKFVEDTLKKNPKIELEELFERAKKVSRTIGKLTKRQFNARYPLQVKRRAAQGKRPAKKGRAKAKASRAGTKKRAAPSAAAAPNASREKVRQILLQFATDITGAEERKDLVKVLASVDRYVDQVMKGVEKG